MNDQGNQNTGVDPTATPPVDPIAGQQAPVVTPPASVPRVDTTQTPPLASTPTDTSTSVPQAGVPGEAPKVEEKPEETGGPSTGTPPAAPTV